MNKLEQEDNEYFGEPITKAEHYLYTSVGLFWLVVIILIVILVV